MILKAGALKLEPVDPVSVILPFVCVISPSKVEAPPRERVVVELFAVRFPVIVELSLAVIVAVVFVSVVVPSIKEPVAKESLLSFPLVTSIFALIPD